MKKIKGHKPLAIYDASLYEGFRCLFASRGRTADLLPIAAMMDDLGFWAVEVWGPSSFDLMHRELNEDPWERIRSLARHFVKTPMACILRGQYLTGKRPFSNDIVSAFIERSATNGIKLFKLFDPLNDVENLKSASRAVLKTGAHLQACLCYNSSSFQGEKEKIFTREYYLEKAEKLFALGAHSLCIADINGFMRPEEARELVFLLKSEIKLPLFMRINSLTGLAPLSLFAAVESGVDGIETCLAPLSMRTSLPAMEPFVAALASGSRDTAFSLEKISSINSFIEESILPKYWHFYTDDIVPMDAKTLLYGLSASMKRDLKNYLKEMKAEESFFKVCEELPVLRRDLGFPFLLSPFDDILLKQAVNNVLFDSEKERYQMISGQIADYCAGSYGKAPFNIDEDLKKKALKVSGELEPLDKLKEDSSKLSEIREELRGLAVDIEDELICALFPITGKRFLRWKYAKESPPESSRGRSLEEAFKIKDKVLRILAGEEKDIDKIPEKSPYLRTFNVFVDNTYYEVGVDEPEGAPVIRHSYPLKEISREEKPQERKIPEKKENPEDDIRKKTSGFLSEDEGKALLAPMSGIIVSFRKKKGDRVKAGESVIILEAMKMENSLPAPVSGVILDFYVKSGESVAKDTVLCRIG